MLTRRLYFRTIKGFFGCNREVTLIQLIDPYVKQKLITKISFERGPYHLLLLLKACSDVARKMHQPGLFCFTHAKNTADRKYPSTASYAGLNEPLFCIRWGTNPSGWLQCKTPLQRTFRRPLLLFSSTTIF